MRRTGNAINVAAIKSEWQPNRPVFAGPLWREGLFLTVRCVIVLCDLRIEGT